MPRKSYVFRNGKLIELTAEEPVQARTEIITDTMPDTWNPVDGRTYDSKSRYYEAVRASGAHIVERGETVGPRHEETSVKADLVQTAKKMGFL